MDIIPIEIVAEIISFVTILPKFNHLHSYIRNVQRKCVRIYRRRLTKQYHGWNNTTNTNLITFRIQQMAYLGDWEAILFTIYQHRNGYIIKYASLINLMYKRHLQCEHILRSFIKNIEGPIYSKQREDFNNLSDDLKEKYISDAIQEVHIWKNKYMLQCYISSSDNDIYGISKLTCDWRGMKPLTKDMIENIRIILIERGWKLKIFQHPMLLWTCPDLWDESIINGKNNNKYGIKTNHL